ncbi:MAG: hypothetical protein KDA93_21115 [Planctomycetaceae bacterium]|nr:hypothetical protein [Planctomycetaceae bacterium]
MTSVPEIDARVTFLSHAEGGRRTCAFDSPDYRPHLVVGDPQQREALLDESGSLLEAYLGVQFLGNGNGLTPGVSHVVTLGLMYYLNVDYSGLSSGTTFTIREGGHIVGYGRVLTATN